MRCFFFRFPDQNVGKGEIQELTGFNQLAQGRAILSSCKWGEQKVPGNTGLLINMNMTP